MRFEDSIPALAVKNKDATRMGHPESARPDSRMRGMVDPRSQNRDLGHPEFVAVACRSATEGPSAPPKCASLRMTRIKLFKMRKFEDGLAAANSLFCSGP